MLVGRWIWKFVVLIYCGMCYERRRGEMLKKNVEGVLGLVFWKGERKLVKIFFKFIFKIKSYIIINI